MSRKKVPGWIRDLDTSREIFREYDKDGKIVWRGSRIAYHSRQSRKNTLRQGSPAHSVHVRVDHRKSGEGGELLEEFAFHASDCLGPFGRSCTCGLKEQKGSVQ